MAKRKQNETNVDEPNNTVLQNKVEILDEYLGADFTEERERVEWLEHHPPYVKRAERLKKQVKDGDPTAFAPLATLFECGQGVPRNFKRAYELRQKGAELNDPEAIVGLAYAKEYGIGTLCRLGEALKLYRRALTFDNFKSRPFACSQLARYIFRQYSCDMTIRLKEKNGKSTCVDGKRLVCDFIAPTLDEESKEILEGAKEDPSPFFLYRLADWLENMNYEPKDANIKSAQKGLIASARMKLVREAKKGNGFYAWCWAETYRTENPAFVAHWAKTVADYYQCVYGNLFIVPFCLEANKMELAFELLEEGIELDIPIFRYNIDLLDPLDDENKKYISFLRNRARKGSKLATYLLGVIYLNPLVERSKREGIAYIRDAAIKGFGPAQDFYARILESNNSDATMCFDLPIGLFKLSDSSFPWRFKAAEHEIESSNLACAVLLYDGYGVEKDQEKAREELLLVELGNDDETRLQMANMCLDGQFGDREVDRGRRALEDLATRHGRAQSVLGSRYYSGDGVPQDYKRAAQWFAKATVAKDPMATLNLAHLFRTGLGVKPNPTMEELLLRIAADKGVLQAEYFLGERLAGEGKWKLATYWLERASLSGDDNAARELGLCYWSGLGVARDFDGAMQLWNRVSNEDELAAEYLARAKSALLVAKLFISDNNDKSAKFR